MIPTKNITPPKAGTIAEIYCFTFHPLDADCSAARNYAKLFHVIRFNPPDSDKAVSVFFRRAACPFPETFSEMACTRKTYQSGNIFYRLVGFFQQCRRFLQAQFRYVFVRRCLHTRFETP